jgi:hypothetical protein
MSDVMLLGVLRMPMPESPDPMTLRQFVSRARQAADRIEADGDEIQRLRGEADVLRTWINVALVPLQAVADLEDFEDGGEGMNALIDAGRKLAGPNVNSADSQVG